MRIILWAKTLLNFLLSFSGCKAPILSAEESVQALKSGRSLIRFGDGEFGIFHGQDIHYQKCSPALTETFENIKNDYIAQREACPYILAVPQKFFRASGWKLMKKRAYVAAWSRSRRDFKRDFPQDIAYADAFLFAKENEPIYRAVWESEKAKHIVFVHNSAAYAKGFAEKYGFKEEDVAFVACPPRDAFEAVEALEKAICEAIEAHAWQKEKTAVLISAGPAGKVIVYDLSKRGYYCVDTGHCWDDPLEGMKE